MMVGAARLVHVGCVWVPQSENCHCPAPHQPSTPLVVKPWFALVGRAGSELSQRCGWSKHRVALASVGADLTRSDRQHSMRQMLGRTFALVVASNYVRPALERRRLSIMWVGHVR